MTLYRKVSVLSDCLPNVTSDSQTLHAQQLDLGTHLCTTPVDINYTPPTSRGQKNCTVKSIYTIAAEYPLYLREPVIEENQHLTIRLAGLRDYLTMKMSLMVNTIGVWLMFRSRQTLELICACRNLLAIVLRSESQRLCSYLS